MRVRKITKTWMFLVGTVVLCLTGCGKETQTADFSGVTSVCELATLKCYYHNVAKAETEASGIYKTIIPRNVRLAEAPSHGLPINYYDARSTGAESYQLLAEEVIHRGDEEWQ